MIQTLRVASASFKQMLLIASIFCLTAISAVAQTGTTSGIDLSIETAYTFPTALIGTQRNFYTEIKNIGTVTSPESTVAYYLSIDNKLDVDDMYLHESTIYQIDPGVTYKIYEDLYFPDNLEVGAYTLFVVVDPKQEIIEFDEINNAKAVALKIIDTPMPDWEVGVVEVLPHLMQAGDLISVGGYFKSIGTSDAPPIKIRVYLSEDNVVDAGDVVLAAGNYRNLLPPGGNGFINYTIRTPGDTPAGAYYIIVSFDPENLVEESDELNNSNYAPVAVGTITALNADAGDNHVTVWPNPATDNINIEVVNIEAGDRMAEISLFNMLGDKVRTQKTAISGNRLSATINVFGLSASMYTAQIRIGNKLITRKIAVRK